VKEFNKNNLIIKKKIVEYNNVTNNSEREKERKRKRERERKRNRANSKVHFV